MPVAHLHMDGASSVLRFDDHYDVWLVTYASGGERVLTPFRFLDQASAEQVADAFAKAFVLAAMLALPVEQGSADGQPPPQTLWVCSCGAAHDMAQTKCDRCGDTA